MRTVGLAQVSFAIASASLAVCCLADGDFAPGGYTLAPWIPGRQAWTCGAALVVLAASAGLLFSHTAVRSVLTIGAYLAAWAVVCIPQILAKPLSIEGWYGFCEALSSLAGAGILCALLLSRGRRSEIPTAGERGVRAAQVLFGFTCLFYGCSHFVYAAYTAAMVPGWLPGRLEFAYITGIGHAAAGVGMVFGILPRLAATLEAGMMSLFGLLVWVPSFFMQPRPEWAGPPKNQWSELVVTLVLTASAWIIATSLRDRARGFEPDSRA